MEELNVLIGMFENPAKVWCEQNGYGFRVVKVDDEDLFVTMELNPKRVNVSVFHGIVQDIKGLY